jgi:hypothetical protein
MEKQRSQPFPPEFIPGDLLEVVGSDWPPGSGNDKGWMGLFQEPGFPSSIENTPKGEIASVLNERLVGTLHNGELCLVVAVSFYSGDNRWYYLLRGATPKKCFGWTRSGYKLRKVQQ